jgi:hypothetical protein
MLRWLALPAHDLLGGCLDCGLGTSLQFKSIIRCPDPPERTSFVQHFRKVSHGYLISPAVGVERMVVWWQKGIQLGQHDVYNVQEELFIRERPPLDFSDSYVVAVARIHQLNPESALDAQDIVASGETCSHPVP